MRVYGDSEITEDLRLRPYLSYMVQGEFPDFEEIICPVHLSTRYRGRQLPLQDFERERIQRCWLFLRTMAHRRATLKSREEAAAPAEDKLDEMNINHIYMLWKLTVYLCENAPEELMERFAINDPEMPEMMGYAQANYQTDMWQYIRDTVTGKYSAKRNLGHDAHETKLSGACERCLTLTGDGMCKKRDPQLGLWDLGD